MRANRPLSPEELTEEQAALYHALADPRLRELLLRNLRVPEGDPEKALRLQEHAERVAAVIAALQQHLEELRAVADRVRTAEGHLDVRPLLRAPALPGAQLHFT